MPKFAYFSEYLRMPGQISVNDLRSRLQNDNLDEGDRVFLALLAMIGRSVDDLESIEQHEMLTAELETASNRITQEVFHYWTQNPRLRVQFLLQRALPGDPGRPSTKAGYSVLASRIPATATPLTSTTGVLALSGSSLLSSGLTRSAAISAKTWCYYWTIPVSACTLTLKKTF